MSMTRPPYASEFRERMVEPVRSGRSPEELAREFEPSAQSIRNWVSQADRDEGRSHDGLTSAEREELRRLRRENHRLWPDHGRRAPIGTVPPDPSGRKSRPQPSNPTTWNPRSQRIPKQTNQSLARRMRGLTERLT